MCYRALRYWLSEFHSGGEPFDWDSPGTFGTIVDLVSHVHDVLQERMIILTFVLLFIQRDMLLTIALRF